MPKIKVGNTHLFFDVYGSQLNIGESDVREKRTMLVLHGAHGVVDHTLYAEFWSKFSDMVQVIFLDQRGCGRSDKRDASEWNLKHWGQDVYDFCEALAIQKPIVAGISMGGHVMCEYMSQYPNHPGALIFCHTEAKQNINIVIEKFRELGGDEVAEICHQNFMSPTPGIVKSFQEKCMPLYGKKGYNKVELNRCIQRPEIFEHYCKHEMKQFNYLDELDKIQCPSLFMVGAKSPGHPPQLTQEMASRVDPKWAHYHEFKDAGAPVYNDSPEEAYQVVSKFIQSVVVSEDWSNE